MRHIVGLGFSVKCGKEYFVSMVGAAVFGGVSDVPCGVVGCDWEVGGLFGNVLTASITLVFVRFRGATPSAITFIYVLYSRRQQEKATGGL